MLTKLVLAGIAAVAAALLGAWLLLPGTTPATEAGNGIAVLEPIPLGGMDQWILIRGEDRSNPVLLWLHGGPGSPQMPIAHATTRALEAYFTVVHWDQRGAGKSNHEGFEESSMSLEQFASDTHALTQYLKQRLGVPNIILLGHSWGTMLGARVVSRWPEDYAAYVAVGQVVNTPRATAMAVTWLRQRAAERNAQDQIDFLDSMTPEAMGRHGNFVRIMRLLEEYGAGINVPGHTLALLALQAPEYSGIDYWRWLDGANRGSGPMWDEYRAADLFSDVPTIAVPTFFLSGRQDMNTPFRLVEEYAEFVDAPLGKELIAFDASGHAPFLTEPDRFTVELVRIGDALTGH